MNGLGGATALRFFRRRCRCSSFRAGGAESESSVERSTSHFQAESARCQVGTATELCLHFHFHFFSIPYQKKNHFR